MTTVRPLLLTVAVAATVAALATSAARAYGDPPITRYVLTFSGPDSAWEIDRGAERLAPKRGMPLKLGDCVVLHGAGVAHGDVAPLLTVIADGREVDVNPARPRYCLQDEPHGNRVALAIARTFTSLASVFHDAERAYDQQSSVPMTTRGGGRVNRPLVRVLDDDRQRLAPGTRALAIGWSAGTPPYAVVLSRGGTAEGLARAETATPRVRLPAVDLPPGTYQIAVTDTAALTTIHRFIVVPAREVPRAAPDVAIVLDDAELSPDVRAAFDAARLMAHPSDAWRFEAYQRVADHGAGSALAARLIFELETE